MKTKQKRLTAKNVTKQDWSDAIKPFDLGTCHACITMHGDGGDWCKNPQHKPLSQALLKTGIFENFQLTETWFRKNFKTLSALRKKFARFWPKD